MYSCKCFFLICKNRRSYSFCSITPCSLMKIKLKIKPSKRPANRGYYRMHLITIEVVNKILLNSSSLTQYVRYSVANVFCL